MNVQELLSQLENLVVEGKRLPLTNRTLVDDNELIHLLEDLRRELPNEIQESKDIIRNKDDIIRSAHEEGENIIHQAKEYAQTLVDDDQIVKQAREKADAIMTQTLAQEKEIIERTQTSATEMKTNADTYANQVLDQLISHVTITLDNVRQAEQGLEQAHRVLVQAKEMMAQQDAEENLPDNQ